MKISNLPARKASLTEVQEQFETWRKNRGKKKAIPDSLWAAAANLADSYQISEIANALRLNYTDLRRHIQSRTSPSPPECTFVEVDRSCSGSISGYLIELEDRFGSRIKVSCSSGPSMNLIELIKTFWCK